MANHFDPDTREVVDGADAIGAPKRARIRRRTSRAWETAPDGTRRRRTGAAPEEIAADAEAPSKSARTTSKPRFAPGMWRYDVDASGVRFKRPLSDEEIAAREQAKVEAERRRQEQRAALAELIPIVRNHDDPPPAGEQLIPLDARTAQGSELVSCVRPNGSRLRLVGRYYDGQARTGHRPLAYVSAYVVFTRPTSGLAFRTRGVMFERSEMRAVAQAILVEADRLDALEKAGELPEFLQPSEADLANVEYKTPLTTNESGI